MSVCVCASEAGVSRPREERGDKSRRGGYGYGARPSDCCQALLSLISDANDDESGRGRRIVSQRLNETSDWEEKAPKAQ